ncbi:unnamed protein product, partial [Allacma fusca]
TIQPSALKEVKSTTNYGKIVQRMRLRI